MEPFECLWTCWVCSYLGGVGDALWEGCLLECITLDYHFKKWISEWLSLGNVVGRQILNGFHFPWILIFVASIARQCAQLWLKARESLNHPLGVVDQPTNLVYPKEILEGVAEKVSLLLISTLSEWWGPCFLAAFFFFWSVSPYHMYQKSYRC